MNTRLTIVNATPERRAGWDGAFSGSDVVDILDFGMLSSTLRRALHEQSCDVERVIIDGAASAISCLEFLATLPHCFSGDVLFISEEGRTFLSATGRGGDRVLYMLEAEDVLFYRAATVNEYQDAVASPIEETLPVRLVPPVTDYDSDVPLFGSNTARPVQHLRTVA